MRVHVRADAEAEDARAAFVLALDVADDLVLVRRADGGPTVGEEDDDEAVESPRPSGFVSATLRPSCRQGERLLQRIVNRRAADGFQTL